MDSVVKRAISRLSRGEDLSAGEAEEVFQAIMGGDATQSQIGALLMGLRVKGETVPEIVGAATAMRRVSVKIPVRIGEGEVLMDTCGTGGDASGTFNISTTVAFIVAASGVKVAKHGNRSITSRSGSADCLEALGKDLQLTPEQVAREIMDIGIGFLFAPNLHPAMKYAAGPRKELGIRTIFNLLGPLTNPANANAQLVGVFSRELCAPLAEVLGRLGVKNVWVVHGHGGLDEVSISGPTHVAAWMDGDLDEFDITPEDAGLERAPIEAIKGGSAVENAAILRAVLDGREKGPRRDVCLLNAGAALVVAMKAQTLEEGVRIAQEIIDKKKAVEVLDAYLGTHS